MTSDEEKKIIDALLDPGWDYRTASGIAKATGIPVDDVTKFLESREDVVWKSPIPDRLGRDLYAHRDRSPQAKDVWRNLSNIMSKTST